MSDITNTEHRSSELELNEEMSEIICPKCDGTGRSRSRFVEVIDDRCFQSRKENFDFYEGPLFKRATCEKCKGKGKLDWVAQVTGKQR